ncbi:MULTISPECIES: hypothetical protein [unclassified Micromonospora]|uniref:hypothetical protein n=1 Tax=unclassified Micromonospora TaxID=2617518 RepID=UPI003638FF08
MLLRMSTLLLRTLREDPADAEVPSHRLLLRAGYVRRAASGGYTWLPLGKLVTMRRGIEVGHIFQLGRRYTDAFAVDVLGPAGKPVRPTMGCYQNAGQCSGLQAGGEGPCWEGRQARAVL